MNKYRKLIPLVAIVLIALGFNGEKFGIDLRKLAGLEGNSTAAQSSQSQASQTKATAPESKPASSTLAGQSGPVSHWSDTSPKVNLWHIFEGEINRKGKPVGYHSRPGGQDPATARVNKVKSGPNRAGVYTASISVQDGEQWKEKFSSFFPDKMSQIDVISAVLNAFDNSKNPNKQPWSGPSGQGFTVQGYTTSRGDINTAFPVFVKSQ